MSEIPWWRGDPALSAYDDLANVTYGDVNTVIAGRVLAAAIDAEIEQMTDLSTDCATPPRARGRRRTER